MSMCIGLNIYRPFLFRISISKSGVDNTKFTSDFFLRNLERSSFDSVRTRRMSAHKPQNKNLDIGLI